MQNTCTCTYIRTPPKAAPTWTNIRIFSVYIASSHVPAQRRPLLETGHVQTQDASCDWLRKFVGDVSLGVGVCIKYQNGVARVVE